MDKRGRLEALINHFTDGNQKKFAELLGVIPQTISGVLPTMTSEFILLYKDTSLLSSVGVMELMMFAKNLTSVSGNMTPYVAAAIFYLIVTLPLIKAVTTVEKRMAKSERGGGKRPKPKGTAHGDAAEQAADEKDEPAGAEPSLAQALSAPLRPTGNVMGGVADVR